MFEKKNAVYFFQMSLFIPGILCKLAKWWRHKLNQILINMMKKDISANLHQKCLNLCSEILLNVLHNRSLTGLEINFFVYEPSGDLS